MSPSRKRIRSDGYKRRACSCSTCTSNDPFDGSDNIKCQIECLSEIEDDGDESRWNPRHIHDGTEPREHRHCMLCFLERQKCRGLKPRQTRCLMHPDCHIWDATGRMCAWCIDESKIVAAAKGHDRKRGLVSTMTREFVRRHLGTICNNCGAGPLVFHPDEFHHPRQLSMNRVNNNKSHDCDSAQTQPVCYQCNKFQNTLSAADFHVLQMEIAAYCARGLKLTTSQIEAPVPKPTSLTKLIDNGTYRLSKKQQAAYDELGTIPTTASNLSVFIPARENKPARWQRKDSRINMLLRSAEARARKNGYLFDLSFGSTLVPIYKSARPL